MLYVYLSALEFVKYNLKNSHEFFLVSCNAQRYEIVNGTTEIELTPEDTKMDEGDDKTAEGYFKNTVSSFNILGRYKTKILTLFICVQSQRKEFQVSG